MGDSAARTHRRQFIRGLAVVGLGLLATCGSTAWAAPAERRVRPATVPSTAADPDGDAPLSPPVTVRVGQVVATSEAGQFIALERGYFEEQGLAIEYSQFNAAGQMTPHLASGNLDVGTGAAGAALFNAQARGIPIKIVGPQARHDPGASAVYVMVRRDLIDDGLVREYQDLAGLEVALNARATASEFGLAMALQQGGLQLTDVELVEMGFPDMVNAFANRAIDVAIQNEPAATVAASRGVAVKWREMGEVRPGIQFTMALYSPEFARTEAARRWMVAYLKGVRDYNDAFTKNQGRDDVIDVLTRHTPVKDASLYTQMGYAYIDPNGHVDQQSLAEQLEWYLQQGQVTGTVDLSQMMDRTFVDHAMQRLGRYD
jgi:ABC-type nitrate/sulfonate/bicarbonate transport system substrate-binding protein